MLKFLLLIFLVMALYRLATRDNKKSFTPRAQNFKNPAAAGRSVEVLLACPKCGTFFRRDQGVEANGKWFCNNNCTRT